MIVLEIGKDANNDGVDDSVQDTVATYLSSDGSAISVIALINPINNQASDEANGWGINNATKLILEGIAEKRKIFLSLEKPFAGFRS